MGFALVVVTVMVLIWNAHAKFAVARRRRGGEVPSWLASPRPSLFFGALDRPPASTPKLTWGQLRRIAATTGSSYVIFWECSGANKRPAIEGAYATERHQSSVKARGLNATFASESERFIAAHGDDIAITSVLNTSSPIIFQDVGSSDMARRDLAHRYGVRQVCALSMQAG
jgi:hypothetical protein